jgi:hypothetical protein
MSRVLLLDLIAKYLQMQVFPENPIPNLLGWIHSTLGLQTLVITPCTYVLLLYILRLYAYTLLLILYILRGFAPHLVGRERRGESNELS